MFIPTDSPFVFGSTKEIDLNHPIVQRGFNIYSQSINKYIALMNQLNTNPMHTNTSNESKQKALQTSTNLINMVGDLIKNYKTRAPKFGLNPDHQNQIIYLDKDKLITKITIDDSNKLKSKMDELFKQLPEISKNMIKYKEIKTNNKSWLYISFSDDSEPSLDNPIQTQIDELKTKHNKAVKTNNTKTMERFNETIANLEKLKNNNESDDILSSIKLAIHYNQKIVTSVFMAKESELNNYTRFLKPATKPINKATLNTIEPNVVTLGFINNVKKFDKLITNKTKKIIENIIETEFTDDCTHEFKEIITNYPKLSFTTRIDKNNKIIINYLLTFNNKESLKKLQTYHTPNLAIFSNKTQFDIKFNLSLEKVLTHIIGLANTLSTKSYKCAMLSELSTMAKQLPTLVTNPQFKLAKIVISGISNINLSIDQLTFDNKFSQVKSFEGILNLTNPSISNITTIAIPSLSTELPKVAKLTPDGKPITIDLNKLTNIPAKLNTNLTKTDLTATTSKYDIKTVSTTEHIQNNTFFDLTITSAFYNNIMNGLIKNELPNNDLANIQIKAALKEIYTSLEMNYTYSIGTNNDSLISTNEIIF